MRTSFVSLIPIILGCSFNAQALDVYKCVNAKGKVLYSDQPCNSSGSKINVQPNELAMRRENAAEPSEYPRNKIQMKQEIGLPKTNYIPRPSQVINIPLNNGYTGLTPAVNPSNYGSHIRRAWKDCIPNSIGPGGCDSIGPGGGKSIGPGGGLSIGPGGGLSISPGGGQSIAPGGGQSIGPGGGKALDRDRSKGLNTDSMKPY